MPLVTSRLILRSEGTGNFVAAINVIHKKKTSDLLHLLLQMFFSFSICLIKSSTPNPSSATLSLCWLVDGKGYYSRIFFNSDHHINGFSLSLTSNRNLFLWISSASFLNGSCFVDKTLNVWGKFHWSSNPMPSYMLFVRVVCVVVIMGVLTYLFVDPALCYMAERYVRSEHI